MAPSLIKACVRLVFASSFVLVLAVFGTRTDSQAQNVAKQSLPQAHDSGRQSQSGAAEARALWASLHGPSGQAHGTMQGSAAMTGKAAFRTDRAVASCAKLRVGAEVDTQRLHVVTRPGLYGIGAAPRGSSYGIVDGRLVRFDPDTMRVQSVVRRVEAILD